MKMKKKSNLWFEIKKGYAFIYRQLRMYVRFYMWELVWLVYTVALALSVGFIGAGMQKLSGSANINVSEVTLFLVTGSLLWGYLSMIVLETNFLVTIERWEGTIEYTFMAPVSRVVHILGMTLFSVLYGLIRTALVLVVVALVLKLDLSNANVGSALLVLMLASLSFVGFGALTAIFPIIAPEKGFQVVHIFDAVLLMVSGIFYPISVLPGWLQVFSKFSPATYTLQGMREAIIHGTGVAELFVPVLLPLIVCGVVLIPVGIWGFTKAEEYAMRTGKLKRDG